MRLIGPVSLCTWQRFTVVKTLSSVEAPSVEKWRENGKRERKWGNWKTGGTGTTRFRFPSPQVPRSLFPLSPISQSTGKTKETSAEDRGYEDTSQDIHIHHQTLGNSNPGWLELLPNSNQKDVQSITVRRITRVKNPSFSLKNNQFPNRPISTY